MFALTYLHNGIERVLNERAGDTLEEAERSKREFFVAEQHGIVIRIVPRAELSANKNPGPN